ncbi:DUF1592 domain-containing protein [Rhodopirellula sp. JC740]|uniref:DUF1592 domain-containing protein n=1 Tax=Rhodopirellula halodulae TaxID=2894198 RepID=A0ABS8NB44_9BACT|nr:DUF1592 domain-containing protein [Rhodopirellula sp. JC740]MCC9640782.1 DUF1592 domain-containing protein [Rhodopirellula sp. JC740]
MGSKFLMPGVCAVALWLASGWCFAEETHRVSDGLLALYTFDEGDGTTIRDRSGRDAPLNLEVKRSESVEWRDHSLVIRRPTEIRSLQPAKQLADAIKRTNRLTVEAWVSPANLTQKGPARIVSLSGSSVQRNVTLGQERDRFRIRLRTRRTSDNGIPENDAGVKLKTELVHLAVTRDQRGKLRTFVDGKLTAEHPVNGELSNWDDSFALLLANEQTGDRAWLGEFHLVAIYDRDLSPEELRQNFRAGANAGMDSRAAERLVVKQSESLFSNQVAPLLARHCLECHDSATQKGGLDLSRHQLAMVGGESGAVITPGNASDSLLWDQVHSGDMPPQGQPLSDEEVTLLKEWIDSGARWSVDFIDPIVFVTGAASQPFVQRLTIDEYIETVRSAVGVEIADEAEEWLPPDLRADGFSNTAYNLNVDLKHVESYARLAQTIVERMDVAKFAKRFSNSRSLNTDATARKFVAALGEHLLRGPLDEREVSNYSGILTAVASAGGSYEQGVGLMIEAMLQSPRFVYRIERQQNAGAVDHYELASRMSYIVWGGPPDATLMQAAADGRLSNRTEIREQVQRMLDDPRAVDRSARFVSDWLHLDRLENMQPNIKRYPHWSPELGRDMRRETLAFFEDVVWKQRRPLSDLFNAPFTYVTPRLAAHYALPFERSQSGSTPASDALQRIDLSEVESRGGLLTHGSVLTIGGDDASMVTRGLFVLRDILRGVIGAPPPGVDTTPVPTQPGMTHRDIAQDRIDNVACGGCHRKFEPLAFGLEQFDGLGAFHTQDEFDNTLRSDGQLVIPGEPQPIAYQTSAELMDHLAASERVRETLTWKLTQFALGRPLGPADAAIVQSIHSEGQRDGGTYQSLLTAIVTSDLVTRYRPPSVP